MQIYGEVLSILTSTHVLVRAYQEHRTEFRSGRELTVYQVVKAEEMLGAGVSVVHLPKGQIRVIHSQTEDLYLAERFREGDRTETRSSVGAVDALFSRQVLIPGQWSASIDDKEILFQPDRYLRVGDVVGEP